MIKTQYKNIAEKGWEPPKISQQEVQSLGVYLNFYPSWNVDTQFRDAGRWLSIWSPDF